MISVDLWKSFCKKLGLFRLISNSTFIVRNFIELFGTISYFFGKFQKKFFRVNLHIFLEYLKEFLDNDLYHFGNLKVLLKIFTKFFWNFIAIWKTVKESFNLVKFWKVFITLNEFIFKKLRSF